ncbi:hypothetical protein MNBD_NITROSPINAE02-1796 [hydrothermal vent metagenome]|uniref:Putative Se/S carrier protein-like domain-containing protein n=1 Tax=hydrothermal vent metagenome TaxID=652676 RepID=A0A3B1CIG0_9ZZZZ
MAKTLIVLFESTNETMRAEKAFKLAGIRVRAVIKPRKISSNCQMALSFPDESLGDVERAIVIESLKLAGYYRRREDGDWVKEK